MPAVLATIGLVGLLLTADPVGRALDGYDRRESTTGSLWARGWSRGDVEWAASFLPDALGRVEQRLGRRRERPFVTILTRGGAELSRLLGRFGARPPSGEVQGVALPGLDLMIVRADLLELSVPGDPTATTVTHEVAHLVIHRRRDVVIPRWLDEGLAVWVSSGPPAPRREAYLSLLARTGGLYRLETLDRAFPAGAVATSIAYQQSCLLVVFLAERWGTEVVGELLDRLEGGASIEAALGEATGLDGSRFEEEFVRWTAGRWSLFSSLLATVNVWAVAAVLALAAFVRRAIRSRRQLRELEREEAESAPADEQDPRVEP